MIDGARIVTPGVLHYARHAAGLYDRAIVVAPGWYLGGDFQGAAITQGYDRDREDALLASIDWPEDGYRLFEISTLDELSLSGWFGPLGEANCLFLRREVWRELGGCEERFDMPGGGLLNLDTYRRALELPGARLVTLAASLAKVRHPSIAIGVDPNPKIEFTLKAETHIFPETSDDFFARQGPADILGNKPLGLGFIDGLHVYEQALRDFINLEAYCGPKSVILFHDTVPLDEPTQRRTCETTFHTGDVWKIVPTLKELRPDLDIFTISTAWTGLTVVTGLDPSSRVLKESYESAVAKFADLPFSAIEEHMASSLNMVAKDWAVVETRLKARGVL